MLETTLLTGPYDWDPGLVPRAEFEARIGAVRTVLRSRGLAGLVVGGLSPEHGALAYLTGFTPKLGPALALVPAEGELRILFSGGASMLPSAQRLTFVADIKAIREVGTDAAAWLRDGGAQFGLWGGNALPEQARRALDRAATSPLVALDGALDPLRRRKSEREIALIRRASDILSESLPVLRAAVTQGQGVRSAALAAERTAYARGAQDVRMLASRRDGGMPQPLEGTHDRGADPLLACIAVRFAGYWAEGLVTVASRPLAALTAAEAARAAVLRAIRPGISPSALAGVASGALQDHRTHPFVAAHIGNGIGLSRQEAPLPASDDALQVGDVCTVRVGAAAEGAENAIASAMVLVAAAGAEVLWQ